jgi:SAM-dependent methyltransferase
MGMSSDSVRSTELRAEMLVANGPQRTFCESVVRCDRRGQAEPPGSAVTNAWGRLRQDVLAVARRSAGVDELLFDHHRSWLGDLSRARVLDLGCFKGNALTLWIAERAGEYVGLDLSEHAIEHLNTQLRERGLVHARAEAGDFLNNGFPDGHFDIVYAYAVLHHFEHRDVVLQELLRVLKPGGLLIATDPLATDPLNRLARRLYRPFQSDRAWEWPFDRAALASVRRYFEVEATVGLQGLVKLSYPFLLVPRLGALGQVIATWGRRCDERRANRPGVPLYLCWYVSLKLRAPRGAAGSAVLRGYD